MSKLGLGMQIIITFFIISFIISGISSFMLIRIKKIKYKSLWEEDKKKATFWRNPERIVFFEALYGNPQWVKENKDARLWRLTYFLSSLISMLFLGLPLILALFGIYLFD